MLDEAYREFVTDEQVPDALTTYGDRPNVVVLRTLSKAWGLAGLRVGFLVGQPGVAAAIRKVVTPFSTSLVAQAAALAALDAEDEVRRRCAIVVAERERVTEALRKLSVEVPTSQAHFVWLPLGDKAAAFGAACESRGVIIRAFQPDGVRVTIGTPEENDAFLAAAEAASARAMPAGRPNPPSPPRRAAGRCVHRHRGPGVGEVGGHHVQVASGLRRSRTAPSSATICATSPPSRTRTHCRFGTSAYQIAPSASTQRPSARNPHVRPDPAAGEGAVRATVKAVRRSACDSATISVRPPSVTAMPFGNSRPSATCRTAPSAVTAAMMPGRGSPPGKS